MSEGLRLTIFIILHVAASMIVFTIVLAAIVFSIRPWIRQYKPVDMAVFRQLEPHVSKRNNQLMQAITLFGSHLFLVPANLFIIFYFLLVRGSNWYSIRAIAVSVSSLLLMFLLKYLFHRKRPLAPLLNAAKGLSFPSGHAIMSATFYGLLGWIVIQSQFAFSIRLILLALLCLMILLIGFSRVYLRVHYASDVIAGFLVGAVWLLITLGIVSAAEAIASGLQ